MAEPRPSMLYVQQTGTQQDQQSQSQTEPQKPSWIQQGIEQFVRPSWTVLCFLVFCGFSFFLGWHSRGWHFSAYYEAPSVDLVGAKTAYHAQPVTQPPADISQALPPEEKQ
jgi:hypothetical protein